ncbi:hypothetical protein V494_00692 [Pseudogymnoascus sp. VKM F-4513 (FW-928)]|nr:hypothetical protein V494_00692 [Pseudogymnoascus sp. VKM F-4513 (FW-928)]
MPSLGHWLRRKFPRARCKRPTEDEDLSIPKGLPILPKSYEELHFNPLPSSLSPFFQKLPVEIRREIYLAAFGNQTLHLDLQYRHPDIPGPFHARLSGKKDAFDVYTEILPILYSTNTIFIQSVLLSSYISSVLPLQSLALVTSLEFTWDINTSADVLPWIYSEDREKVKLKRWKTYENLMSMINKSTFQNLRKLVIVMVDHDDGHAWLPEEITNVSQTKPPRVVFLNPTDRIAREFDGQLRKFELTLPINRATDLQGKMKDVRVVVGGLGIASFRKFWRPLPACLPIHEGPSSSGKLGSPFTMFSGTVLTLCALVLGCLILGTNAGAGANVNGCVYYASRPPRPIKVTFDVPTSVVHCMYDKGSNATTQVENAGYTCASVGHVSGKSSSSGGDLCATDDSRWGMSYTAGPKSGTTYSTWHAPVIGSDHIDLYGRDALTRICGSASKCDYDTIKISSGGQDSVYIIFDPLSELSIEEDITQEVETLEGEILQEAGIFPGE